MHAHGLNDPIVLHFITKARNSAHFASSFPTPQWQPLSIPLLNNMLRWLFLEVSIWSIATMENEGLTFFFFFFFFFASSPHHSSHIFPSSKYKYTFCLDQHCVLTLLWPSKYFQSWAMVYAMPLPSPLLLPFLEKSLFVPELINVIVFLFVLFF